jgi:HK97 family phage major capsid protein
MANAARSCRVRSPQAGAKDDTMRLQALRAQAAQAVAEMMALSENAAERPFTTEEDDKFKALEEKHKNLLASIAQEERIEAARRAVPQSASAADLDQAAAVASARAAGVRVDASNAETNGGDERFASFGHQLQAVANAARPGGRVDRRLMAGPTGLHESVGSDGGFLVQTDQQTQIRQRVYSQGNILSRVTRIPISANSNGIKLFGIDETSRADGSRYGGIRSYWTAEGGLKLDSKPKFREMDMRLHKIAALVYATDELLQDTTALEAWIQERLPDELRFKAEDAILTGTGAGMPLGIFNSGAAITVSKEVGQAAGTIVFENIVNMWSRLYAPSRSNAVWLVDQSAESQLYTMSLAIGAGGIPVYMPAGGISGAPFSTLFGRPIIPVEYLSQVGTKGDIVLADLSQYVVIDKGDVQSASSMHVRFLYDEMVFRFVYRIDGQPEWNSPLTPKNSGPTLSPFVVLETRS